MTTGITAGAALMLTACGPDGSLSNGQAPSPSATGSVKGQAGQGGQQGDQGSADGKGGSGAGAQGASAQPAGSAAPAKLNGTAGTGLTISDGTRYVVMNGTRVDFGTEVRDLAWAPDGHRAVFVDGDGDLVTAAPDGSDRVVLARNPGGQTWSHPTWRHRDADPQNGFPAADDIFFVIRAGGVSRLYQIPSGARDGRPTPLPLAGEPTEGMAELPQTGNVWPSAGGRYGESVYANSDTGKVYIRDDYLRQQGSAITEGSEPAAADTGNDIVFVRSVGGHDHLFLEHSADSGPQYTDLTPGATTDYTEPAFAPGGRTVAARTPDGIVTLPVDGSHAPVKVSGYVGLPAYRTS
ncbi:hypothetical protein ITX44_14785 [Streptomyces sp. KK5PA1]|uniref:Uncharacterized protein n=1 Tax=Actinacidiphila acididurans TaxID=2784346 RepID=A0ABS2TRT8_9ACTN|nr:hypothetical protein [Actinacidiphila acididurans]